MSHLGAAVHAKSALLDAASKLDVHTHAGLPWNVVLPVLIAILFFGAFTTVYILMRRPSFGERGIDRELNVTSDVEQTAH